MERKVIPLDWLFRLANALERNKKIQSFVNSQQIISTALWLWKLDAERTPVKLWKSNFKESGIPWAKINRSVDLLIDWGLIKQTNKGGSWKEVLIEE